MKKLLLVVFLVAMLVALPACNNKKDEVKVLSYAEYQKAENDSNVVIEAYVQAKQGWWDNTATVYLQDKDGGYFVYNMACSEEDYAKIPTGTKIRVTGTKTEWMGEVEIAAGSTFEIIEGDTWTATAVDVTSKLGTDSLINYQNQLVSFKGLTIAASTYEEKDGEGKVTLSEERAYLYKYNGTGKEGDDLYFNVSDGKNTYTFTVESYLCGVNTEVYQTIKTLNIGDTVNLEGFAYWYDGLNPHITSCKLVK